MKIQYFVMFLFVMVMGCAPQMNAVWQKDNYSPKSLDRIAVIAIDENLEVRRALENSLISELEKYYDAKTFIAGLDVIPPNADEEKWNAEYIEKKLEDMDVDGVFTVCIIDAYDSERLRTGNNISYPAYYRAGGRIYQTYRYISAPDYYETVKNFVLQGSLYDLRIGQGKEDNMYWMGESSVSNPSTITSGASTYAKNLVRFVKSDSYLK